MTIMASVDEFADQLADYLDEGKSIDDSILLVKEQLPDNIPFSDVSERFRSLYECSIEQYFANLLEDEEYEKCDV